MRTCEEHPNVVVVYDDRRNVDCPLCMLRKDYEDLKKELDKLEDKLSKLTE